MIRLRRFLDLPHGDKGMLLAALGQLPLLAAGVHVFGFKRMRTFLAGMNAPLLQVSESQKVDSERVARAVRTAARHGLVRGTCLSRSLLLWHMLRRRGIPAKIRFGVRPAGSGMQAHAWIEQQGRSLDHDFDNRAFSDLKPARPRDPAGT
jgi:hypothetical protein